MKFGNKNQLKHYIYERNYPEELQREMLCSIKSVEQCNIGRDDFSALYIAETTDEEKEIEKAYNLTAFLPESDETNDYNGEKWTRRVFVFGDDGHGIIVFGKRNVDDNRPDF